MERNNLAREGERKKVFGNSKKTLDTSKHFMA
jgi:hypothetical protein